MGGQIRGLVSLSAAATANNASVDDLVVDLNEALAGAGWGSEVVAGQMEGRLTLSLVGAVAGQSIEMILSSVDPAATLLHFTNGQREGTLSAAYPLGNLAGVAKVAGLTLPSLGDADWFMFTLASDGVAGNQIAISAIQGRCQSSSWWIRREEFCRQRSPVC